MERYKYIITYLILIVPLFLWGQLETPKGNDRVYNDLLNEFSNAPSNEKRRFVADKIITKAKTEKNKKYLIIGYNCQAVLYENEKALSYADSIIQITKTDIGHMYPMEAFKIKGDHYFNQTMFKEAFNQYLQVANYAEIANSKEYQLIAEYNIADLKRRLNEKEEALAGYRKVWEGLQRGEIKMSDTLLYMSSLHSIANIFTDLNNPDSASYYNRLGYRKAVEYNFFDEDHHFALNQGVSHYQRGEYQIALDSLIKHTAYYELQPSANNMPYAYYYLGKVYQKLNQQDSSVLYFKKVDSLFKHNNTAHNIIKDSYAELVNFYKDEGDLQHQIYYTNQLIIVDSLLTDEKMFLSTGIYKKYDIPRLREEKRKAILELSKKEKDFQIVKLSMLLLLTLTVLTSLFQFYNKTLYKRKFKNLIGDKLGREVKPIPDKKKQVVGLSGKNSLTYTDNSKKKLNIPEITIKDILNRLSKFEEEKGYLDIDVTLNSLAKEINSNSNYVSKIVNHYKKQSFANYLNQLRIDHFVERAKVDPKIKRYTIKAIANEFGFRSSESFSKAFQKLNGIKPSFFLREIDVSKKET
ncbi:helix-turn-helix domain-containing protein [Nonlabens xiamenensis]|uniref:helix-turn-helix domain-containing protein n=1 Tax=Nonlabens xiamenensis TaxID=2341043 RepID=UPI000F60C273|nr:helix-turn-helix domain-containing protein [Nonlabens xiamenensis]